MLHLFLFLLFAFLFETSIDAEPFTNPIKWRNGSDPFITFNNADGYYYYLTTTFDDVQLVRARTLNGLKAGEKRVVYKDSNPTRCCHVWAPELHEIDGTWYIYFTAGQQRDLSFQRLHVLRGASSPWSRYTYSGQLLNEWAIDGTVAKINNRRYFYWSCQRNGLQSLCGADLLSPTRAGPARLISAPLEAFERHGKISVNEGPAHVANAGRDYLIYSASFCGTAQYSLGQLALRPGGDPLDTRAWTKSGPLMRSANGNFGPGHNGFFQSPDGTQTWIVYHATPNANGDCDKNRYTMASLVNFTDIGVVIGAPPRLGGGAVMGPSGES